MSDAAQRARDLLDLAQNGSSDKPRSALLLDAMLAGREAGLVLAFVPVSGTATPGPQQVSGAEFIRQTVPVMADGLRAITELLKIAGPPEKTKKKTRREEPEP